MRKLLPAATALAAFFGLPAMAADLPTKATPAPVEVVPPVSGFLGIWGGSGRISERDNDDRERTPLYGGEARINFRLNPSWSLQLDAEGEKGTHAGDVSDDQRHHILSAAHFNWRDQQVGSLGLFGGWARANNTNDNKNTNFGFVGLEGQRYYGALTLYGQGGYFDQFKSISDSDNITNTWFVRFAPRYFLTPNDRLSAEIGYARGDVNDQDGNRIRVVNWGAMYEHKFDRHPLSVFIQYTGGDLKSTNNPEDRIIEHTVMAGVRLYFGQGTLLSNDRTGATYDTPGFIRYIPHVGIAD
jgi:hypothetical protein